MRLAAIFAAARNGVIGKDGQMPWRLSADLQRFKRLTLGKPVIMGRRTFESIGKPLAGRTNVVVSRHPGSNPDVTWARSLDEALALVAAAPEAMLIGGAQLFAEGLARCDTLYFTRVEAELEGDAVVTFAPGEWRVVSEEHHPADAKNDYATTFIHYEREGT